MMVIVGLISVAPLGNIGAHYCRMAASPYPAYDLSANRLF